MLPERAEQPPGALHQQPVKLFLPPPDLGREIRAADASPLPTGRQQRRDGALRIAQVAQKRFGVKKAICRVMDPARAEWYGQQGLQTISPTKHAIEMFESALGEGEV